MKSNKIKKPLIILFSVVTILLFILSLLFDFCDSWKINASDCIEIFILIFVSYYLVDCQNSIDRKKEKINDVISKIQERILDPELIVVETPDNKKVTRIKLTSISNLLEIVKEDITDKTLIESVVIEMDSLNAIVMDHIDDTDYIKKSNSEIVRLVTNIDTKLEKIKFSIN